MGAQKDACITSMNIRVYSPESSVKIKQSNNKMKPQMNNNNKIQKQNKTCKQTKSETPGRQGYVYL